MTEPHEQGPDYAELAGRNFSNANWTDYYVTAGQLRERLAGIPDDTLVVLAKDGEGNGFSPLSLGADGRLGVAWYVPESTWAGDVYDLTPDPDDPDGYEQDGSELFAVVLDPTN